VARFEERAVFGNEYGKEEAFVTPNWTARIGAENPLVRVEQSKNVTLGGQCSTAYLSTVFYG
jgi:hypothetical protein